MRTLAWRSRMRLISSMPLPVFRDRSTTATSGFVEAARRSASAISSASPQTARSGWRPIRSDSASRIAGWSSTIRTRARFPALFLAIALVRPGTGNHGAMRLRRFNRQCRADHGGAIAHDPQAHALIIRGAERHPRAVIFDPQDQQAVRLQRDADGRRLGMLQGIVDRLLRDEKDVRG